MIAEDELRELSGEIATAPDGALGDLYDRLVAMLNESPDDHRLRFLFATVACRAKHLGVAKAILEPMLRSHGNWGALRVNYGMTLDGLGDMEGALHQYRHATSDPKVDKSNLHANRATALIKLGRYEEASEACTESIKLNPDNKDAAISKGFARIALGDLGPGWDLFNRAVGTKHRISIDYGVPHWRGEERGTRLIVHGEQGLGDEIMYASCIADVIDRVDALAIDCDAKLSKLFRRSFPGAQVYGSRNAKDRPWLGEFRPTHSIGIGSLPGRYRREASDFKPRAYLQSDPALRLMYRSLIEATHGAGLATEVIGIAWSGGGPETKAKLREIPLEAFAPLTHKYPNAAFVSLQYREDAQAQIDASGLSIQNHLWATGKGAGYDHTAAIISACDRVIATDTTVVHAAGAMGVPTDCLLTTPSMWVWGNWMADKAAWYPAVRLLRRPADYNWERYVTHLVNQSIL